MNANVSVTEFSSAEVTVVVILVTLKKSSEPELHFVALHFLIGLYKTSSGDK